MNFKALALTTLVSIGAVAAPAQAQTGWTVYNVSSWNGEVHSVKVIRTQGDIKTVQTHNDRLNVTLDKQVNCSNNTFRSISGGATFRNWTPVQSGSTNAKLYSFICN
jgi:hypothetical protein